MKRIITLLIGLLLLAASVKAQQVTSFPPASLPLSGAEQIYVVQGGYGRQTTTGAILGGSAGPIVWPTIGDLLISNGTQSPGGLAPVNGDCVLGAGGIWVAGACGAGSVTSLTSSNCVALTPSTITSTGAIAASTGLRRVTSGTIDTVVATDCTDSYAQSSALSLTLPPTSTTGFGSGFGVTIAAQPGSGGVNVTSSSNIGSSTTLAIPAGSNCFIYYATSGQYDYACSIASQPFDDPNNTSGLGAQAIRGGQIYLPSVNLGGGIALVMGAGQSSTQQGYNCQALQAALTYGAANNLPVVSPEGGTIEKACTSTTPTQFYNGSGTASFVWRVNPALVIKEFTANLPVMIFGDPSGAGTTANAVIDGGWFLYGVSQTGNSSAIGTWFGPCEFCAISNFHIASGYGGGGTLVNPPYTAFQVGLSASTTLSAAITSPTQTSITVTSATNFPTGISFIVTIGSEKMLVAATAGSTSWNVLYRGYEGTTATTYTNGTALSTGGGQFFSNVTSNIEGQGAQYAMYLDQIGGTQNQWTNLYATCGGGSSYYANALTQGAYYWTSDGDSQYGDTFSNINVEWCEANNLVHFNNVTGAVVTGLRFEGDHMTGSNPSLVSLQNSSVAFVGEDSLNLRILTTEMSGTAAFISTYGTSAAIAHNVTFKWTTSSGSATTYTGVFQLYGGNGVAGAQPVIQMSGITFNPGSAIAEGGSFVFDGNMTAADYPVPLVNVSQDMISNYTWGNTFSLVTGAMIWPATSTYTVYGQQTGVVLFYAGTTSATQTVNLSNYNRSSGTSYTTAPGIGQTAQVCALAGTGGATINVYNAAATLIGSVTVNSGSEQCSGFIFNGASWTNGVAGTPTVSNVNTTTLIANGTVSLPGYVSVVHIIAAGQGGCSGAGTNVAAGGSVSGGGGGGGGGYKDTGWLPVATFGSSVTATFGTSCTAAAAGNSGGAGASVSVAMNSAFDTLVANGGGGGAVGASATATGGGGGAGLLTAGSSVTGATGGAGGTGNGAAGGSGVQGSTATIAGTGGGGSGSSAAGVAAASNLSVMGGPGGASGGGCSAGTAAAGSNGRSANNGTFIAGGAVGGAGTVGTATSGFGGGGGGSGGGTATASATAGAGGAGGAGGGGAGGGGSGCNTSTVGGAGAAGGAALVIVQSM